MPEITMLMTVFNGEKYLREAIESILNQTFKDFEFLIVDDGSEDKSVEIITSYKDKRIKLIRNEQNMGIPGSANRGIKLAEGKYIARMDCDDISLPERLEKQFLFMEKNPHIGASSVWVEVFGMEKGFWKAPLSSEAIKCDLLFGCSLAHSGAIIKKSIFTEEGILYDEAFDCAVDHDLWSRISQKFPVANIGEILIRNRRHKTQLSAIKKKEQKLNIDIILKNQLSHLGINPTERELTIHSNLTWWKFEDSLTFLDDTEAWLTKIYMANKKNNIYNEEELLKLLAYRWWMSCKYASTHGLIVWKRFWNSPLSKHNTLSHRDKIKFFLKALIRKKIFRKF